MESKRYQDSYSNKEQMKEDYYTIDVDTDEMHVKENKDRTKKDVDPLDSLAFSDCTAENDENENTSDMTPHKFNSEFTIDIQNAGPYNFAKQSTPKSPNSFYSKKDPSHTSPNIYTAEKADTKNPPVLSSIKKSSSVSESLKKLRDKENDNDRNVQLNLNISKINYTIQEENEELVINDSSHSNSHYNAQVNQINSGNPLNPESNSRKNVLNLKQQLKSTESEDASQGSVSNSQSQSGNVKLGNSSTSQSNSNISTTPHCTVKIPIPSFNAKLNKTHSCDNTSSSATSLKIPSFSNVKMPVNLSGSTVNSSSIPKKIPTIPTFSNLIPTCNSMSSLSARNVGLENKIPSLNFGSNASKKTKYHIKPKDDDSDIPKDSTVKKFGMKGSNKDNPIWRKSLEAYTESSGSGYIALDWLKHSDVVKLFVKTREVNLSPTKTAVLKEQTFVFDTNSKQNIMIRLSKYSYTLYETILHLYKMEHNYWKDDLVDTIIELYQYKTYKDKLVSVKDEIGLVNLDYLVFPTDFSSNKDKDKDNQSKDRDINCSNFKDPKDRDKESQQTFQTLHNLEIEESMKKYSLQECRFYPEMFIYNLVNIEDVEIRLRIVKFFTQYHQKMSDVTDYYNRLANSLAYLTKGSNLMEIFIAILGINNTLNNTSYAMLTLDSLRNTLDSRGYDEAKTSLLEFVLDRKFRHYYDSLCSQIELAEHASGFEFETKFKHFFELEYESHSFARLASIEIKKIDETYAYINTSAEDIKTFCAQLKDKNENLREEIKKVKFEKKGSPEDIKNEIEALKIKYTIYSDCKINLDSFVKTVEKEKLNADEKIKNCKTLYDQISSGFGMASSWQNINKFLGVMVEVVNEILRKRTTVQERYSSMILKFARKMNFEKKLIKHHNVQGRMSMLDLNVFMSINVEKEREKKEKLVIQESDTKYGYKDLLDTVKKDKNKEFLN